MKGVRQQYEGCISGTYTLHTSGIIKACCKYESCIKEHTRSIRTRQGLLLWSVDYGLLTIDHSYGWHETGGNK